MKTTVLASLAVLLLAGCATTPLLSKLQVGMSKQEVIAVMGEPESKAAQGRTEVFRYRLSTPAQIMTDFSSDEYYVRFVDGRLESFGRMGDFNSTIPPTVRIQTETNESDKSQKGPTPDAADQLRKLKKLLDDGLITDEDYEIQKKRILDRM